MIKLPEYINDIITNGWYDREVDGQTKMRYTKGYINHFLDINITKETYEIEAKVNKKNPWEMLYYNKSRMTTLEEVEHKLEYEMKMCEDKAREI
jgi:hypothetical protein